MRYLAAWPRGGGFADEIMATYADEQHV